MAKVIYLFGSEFLSSQTDLPKVLELADEHITGWQGFEAAVCATYSKDHNTSDYNKGKLANNTKHAMRLKASDQCREQT